MRANYVEALRDISLCIYDGWVRECQTETNHNEYFFLIWSLLASFVERFSLPFWGAVNWWHDNEPDRVKISSHWVSRATTHYKRNFIGVMPIQQENILGDIRRTSARALKTLSLVFGSPSEQFCPKITFSMVVSKRNLSFPVLSS